MSKANSSHLSFTNNIPIQEARQILLRHFKDEKSVMRGISMLGSKQEVSPKVNIK